MRGTRFLAYILPAFLFCISALPAAYAAPNRLEMQSEDERLIQWDLSADSVTAHNESEILEARGNVYLRRGKEYLKADYARYYMSTKWVFLQGNVVVRMGRDELKAEEAEFDLRSRVGWLKKGKIFMEGPHIYLAGEHIDKHWGEVYTFKNAKVTACDGDVPAWSLTAQDAVVELDGYARLSHAAFQVKDNPVAYSPFFIMPAKRSRQTGLLIPQFGQSSSKGAYYNQPFFWAIDESNDLTLNEYVMEKRGFMHGAEFRTRPYADTAAWLRADWLNDGKVNKDVDSGDYTDDSAIRNNHERWWIRGMVDTTLSDPNWRFKADIDLVSDQDFLSEFKNDYPGFRRTREELFSIFHRDLQEKNRNRESGMLLTRDWQRATLALSAFYSQDPSLGHGNKPLSQDTTVQQLPEFDAFWHQGRIFPDFPLEAQASAQAVYMYRQSGTRGGRYQVTPKVTMPLTSRYGSIIASAGITQTLYDAEQPGHSSPTDPDGPKEDGTSRTVPEFSVAAASELARVYPLSSPALRPSNGTLGQNRWAGLRHSVQPRVEYRQVPMVDQNDNPYYDDEDRLLPRTELVYSLTNVLTVKREKVVLSKNDAGEMVPSVQTGYLDLINLRIEQAYDQREATRDDDVDTYERRPFGDIFVDLVSQVDDSVWVSTRNNWSPYLQDFTRHQSGVTVDFERFGRYYAGFDLRKKLDEYQPYRKRDRDMRFVNFTADVDLLGPFSLTADYDQDLEDSGNQETSISLRYNHQCFALIGEVNIEPQGEDYRLMIMLTGLGD